MREERCNKGKEGAEGGRRCSNLEMQQRKRRRKIERRRKEGKLRKMRGEAKDEPDK